MASVPGIKRRHSPSQCRTVDPDNAIIRKNRVPSIATPPNIRRFVRSAGICWAGFAEANFATHLINSLDGDFRIVNLSAKSESMTILIFGGIERGDAWFEAI